MHLYIGYKRYSSWSLRPWLAMKVKGIPFKETVLPFAHNASLSDLARDHQVPATVPVLDNAGMAIWDSIAILEFLAETYPEKNLWPAKTSLRALARCCSAEMHSGFIALRTEHPMNCHLNRPLTPSSAVQKDLDRLAVIWKKFAKAEKPPGNFLCGEFSNADAMFAPIAWRIKGYGLKVSDDFETWSNAMMNLPAMTEWVNEGATEKWRIDAYEAVEF